MIKESWTVFLREYLYIPFIDEILSALVGTFAYRRKHPQKFKGYARLLLRADVTRDPESMTQFPGQNLDYV